MSTENPPRPMNEESVRRLAIARRIAAAAAANPRCVGVILVGSTARGDADPYSDIDLSIYHEARPTPAELAAFRERAGMEEWRLLGGTEDTDFVDCWKVEGIEGQSGNLLVAGVDELLDDVLERFDTDHDKHTIVGGLAEGIALHGGEILERIQRRITYPDGLARAMVEKHLSFRPAWLLEHRFAGRDALFPFAGMLVEWERRILGILLGLNRVYPEHDFKRLDKLLRRLTIAPRDLDGRLRRILRSDYEDAVRELAGLVDETIGLVERHMPEVDTAAVRAELAKPDPGAAAASHRWPRASEP